MEVHGDIAPNLGAAVQSSRRLKGHPIHRDTLQFWSDLIAEARSRRAAGEVLDDPEVAEAIAELEVVIADATS
jgi:hypothetical protein